MRLLTQKDLQSENSGHTKDEEFLRELKEVLNPSKQKNIPITAESVPRYLKSLPKWKAPGYWLEHFICIAHKLQDCLTKVRVP